MNMQKKISKWFQNTNSNNKNHKSNSSQEKDQSKKEEHDLKLAIEASLALVEEEEKQFQNDIKKAKSLSHLNNNSISKKMSNKDNHSSTSYLGNLSDNNSSQSTTKKSEKTIPNIIKEVNIIEVDNDNKLFTPPSPKVEVEYNWNDVEAFVKDVTTFGVNHKPTSKNVEISQQNNKRKIQDHYESILTNRSSASESNNLIDQSIHTTKSTKGNWHDEDAENLFFGQFKKETWNKNDIIKAHNESKKRSMSSAIKDSNKRLKSNRVTQERSYNYYNTSDEIIEDSFEDAGFGSSLTPLSYEGIGQARYA